MNIPLIISLVIILVAIAGLVVGFLKRADYPTAVIRRGVGLLVVGLVAGGLHALAGAKVIHSSTTLTAVSTIADVFFFVLLLIETIRMKKAQRRESR